MRLRGCLAIVLVALSGCVAAPAGERTAAHTQGFSPASANRERIEPAAYQADDEPAAVGTAETGAPERSGWFSCNCRSLRKTIDKQQKEIDQLKEDYRIASEGFRYVTLEWIKAALFYRGYYGDIDVPAPRVEDLVFSDLGLHTVRASQKFQCDFARQTSAPGLCDPRTKTGWLTFIEARDLICRGAYEFILPNTTRPKADPDLTLLVAEWYQKGRVYEQNPRIAYFLLKELLENITYRFERSNDPTERERLGRFQRRALDAMDMIAATPKVSVKNIRHYSINEVCPVTL